MPHLSSFILKDCSFHDAGAQSILDIIKNHHDTITNLALYDYEANDTNPASGKQWATILQTAKTLRQEAVVKISNPFLYAYPLPPAPWPTDYDPKPYVSLTPLHGHGIDKDLVSVYHRTKDRRCGLYYSTQAGELHESLDCMIGSYKEYESIEAMRSVGVLGEQKPEAGEK